MSVRSATKLRKFLFTGGLGQLGVSLFRSIENKYGLGSVILTDVKEASNVGTTYIKADATNPAEIENIVVKNGVTDIVHFAALLSAIGEKFPEKAIKLNVESIYPLFDIARRNNLSVFIPSTIGAFGPESPRNPTPDLCIQRPKTLYGIGKLYTEILGEYFYEKYGVNFRSLRYPGILSYEFPPGGGTTDYAIDLCQEAVRTGSYACYLKEDTRMPMMYIDDFVTATCNFLDTPNKCLTRRIYNIDAMSFTPKELYEKVKQKYPDFKMTYEIDPVRQSIADSWPQRFDDQNARKDWGWKSAFNIDKTVDELIAGFRQKYPKSK